MKKKILFVAWFLAAAIAMHAQVTQINSNKSLEVNFPLSNTKAIVVSALDNSLWVTDGTLAGTIQISATIKYDGGGLVLSGKFIFRGNTAATGSEVYITDGTGIGTVLVRDIYNGPISSNPGDFVTMNGIVYFSAVTAAEGRELWKTNGTFAGTSLVKDIVAGPDSSNNVNNYHLYTHGNYLLFAAKSAAAGLELWKSDGTGVGTNLLIDINTGNAGADSSSPANFFTFNSMVLFTAKAEATGNEIWKTDGTAVGTVLMKDINPGPLGSTEIEIFPGFSLPLFLGFHIFNNKVYFQAFDGTDIGELWVTDGIPANTILLKTIISGPVLSYILLADAVNLPGKFIFPVTDNDSRSELWVSDGTPGGTILFKEFSPSTPGELPIILVPYFSDFVNGTYSQVLFQGNKFFFTGATATEGNELWISDGTIGGTSMVKDINPGPANGIEIENLSYIYTSTTLFFPANNTANGLELWKSDGTNGGTVMVADIVTGPVGCDPMVSGFITNGKVLFEADNGDSPASPVETDLYAVDGNFTPLPISLSGFSVVAREQDALVQWQTQQEINSKEFIVQRSYDAMNFINIGTISAAGNSSSRNAYSFTDADIINCGQPIVYYRLLSTDMDGKKSYSEVIALKLKVNHWKLRLVTNPVMDDIKLAVTGVTGNVQVQVNDLSGKPVYSKMHIANAIINIPSANLPHGMYVLMVNNAGEKKSVRFIK